MKNSLTPKQEKFCRVYTETSNATEAYRQSYNIENMKPETINRSAKELMDNPKIATRLDILQDGHNKRHNVTVDSLTEELEEARTVGKTAKQGGAMTQATMGKAKIHGLVADKPMSDLNITVNLVSFNE